MDAMKSFAAVTHFRVVGERARSFTIANIGLERAPSPITWAAQHEHQAHRAPQEPRTSAPPRGPDAYGRVNGQMPPLILGNRVFEIWFRVRTLEHAVFIDQRGRAPFMHTTWRLENGESVSLKDYCGGLHPPSAYVPGEYRHLGLRDTRTNENFACLFMPMGGAFRIRLMWEGIMRRIPWVSDPVRFAKVYEGFPLVDDYFGCGNNRDSKDYIAIMAKFVHESHYWSACECMNNVWTPEQCRDQAWVTGYDSMLRIGYKERVVRKYGFYDSPRVQYGTL